jgi:NAD(P)-dependent dehydrogenase (short-subunit alcohol dehydrogenase family)
MGTTIDEPADRHMAATQRAQQKERRRVGFAPPESSYRRKESNMSTAQHAHKVALITGAASGLGRAIALALKSQGFTVLGTSRHPQREPSDYPLLALDVRSDESVRAAIEAVRATAGRLDVLVNNAGARLVGAVEETTVDEAQALFDTNVFGTHRVTRAALPLLREARGRIVNVSSLTGLNAVPFAALYSASKWAIEAYAEALRQEVRPFGVHVALVEPGPIRTPARQGPARAQAPVAAYDVARARAIDAILQGDETGMAAAQVVACVVRVVTKPSPRLRYRVGPAATWLPRLKMLFPWSWYEYFLRRRYALDG